MPSWTGSCILHTGSSCPARACESNVSASQLERKQVNLGIDSLGKIAAAPRECKILELFLEPAPDENTLENLRRGRRSGGWAERSVSVLPDMAVLTRIDLRHLKFVPEP